VAAPATLPEERRARQSMTSKKPARGRVRSFLGRHSGIAYGIVSLLLAALLWEIAASQLSSLIIAPLSVVWDSLVEMAGTGELWTDLAYSGQAFIAGFLLSAVVGVLIGMVTATNKVVHGIVDPWISALYATPTIALAPLFIIIFGIDLSSKIAVAFLLAVFPVIINTMAGIRTADPHLIEGAYSFGATRFQIFRKVLFPSAIPFIITGFRLAIGRALIGVVVAEFFGSRAGIGHMVFNASQRFDTGAVFAGVFIMMGVATVLMKLMEHLENRIAPWRGR
jgi:ABC-type nitrate/sulfonate/bicarbonate transport system permease component